MPMWRVFTSVLLACAMALAIPQAMFAQRGGGHVGGFSGGGGARGFGAGGARGFGGGFGGSFSGPRAGFTGPTFQAPRMNFGPGVSGNMQRPALGYPGARSSFGQLGYPAIRRVPYPVSGTSRAPYPVSGTQTGRTSNGQGWHGGNHDWHHGYHPYYYHGHLYYSYYPYVWPYYGNWWLWPWGFSNWDSPSYDDQPQAAVQPDQSYAPSAEPEPAPEEPPAYQLYLPQAQPAAPDQVEPPLTIVYKDGHSQYVRNYAVTRTSLLLLDEALIGRTPEISLDEINLPATEQINRAAGINFRVPVGN